LTRLLEGAHFLKKALDLPLGQRYTLNPNMASASSTDSKALASSLSKLNISSKKPKAAPVADSWEDEDLSDEDTETDEPSKHKRNTSNTEDEDDGTSAPPPTPASPSGKYPDDVLYNPYKSIQPSRERGSGNKTPERRPEKTTSVAARMIAGSLGVRAPKRTEEQREFDKAVKEKEKKRRAEEKDRAEQAEKLKASVWED
jgi:hypothetical protein